MTYGALNVPNYRAQLSGILLNGRVSKNKAVSSGPASVVYVGTLGQGETEDKVGTADSDLQTFFETVHALSKLEHANVLPLLGITTDFNMTVSIVTPWMEKGNAHDYVQNKGVDPRPLIKGIAEGLHYLHNREPNAIFHGNLKGVNVLISGNDQALLTDFGLCHLVNFSPRRRDRKKLHNDIGFPSSGWLDANLIFPLSKWHITGLYNNIDFPPSRWDSEPESTLKWPSPEISAGGEISAQADVRTFGMTVLELFTRQCPVRPPGTSTLYDEPGPHRPSIEDTYGRMTDEWWDLCSECWKHDPAFRPTIFHIIKTIASITHTSEMPV